MNKKIKSLLLTLVYLFIMYFEYVKADPFSGFLLGSVAFIYILVIVLMLLIVLIFSMDVDIDTKGSIENLKNININYINIAEEFILIGAAYYFGFYKMAILITVYLCILYIFLKAVKSKLEKKEKEPE